MTPQEIWAALLPDEQAALTREPGSSGVIWLKDDDDFRPVLRLRSAGLVSTDVFGYVHTPRGRAVSEHGRKAAA